MNRRDLQPYPGLRPFERHESRIFFGRQQQVDELLSRLKQHHFLAILGASGSGKSSLVKAGLLAGLEKGYMGEVGSRWSIAEMRPGNQPFVRLAEALVEGNVFISLGENEVPSLSAELRRGTRSLHEILQHSPLPDGNRLLLLVDQFEEMFRFREQEENQAAAFVALLLEACQHENIYVVITMRSDFLGAAAEFHGLPESINSGLYLTPRLTRNQLREAISIPAQLFGGSVDDELINHLLNEAGSDPDQLPLLQHALMRHWECDADKTLTLEEHLSLNGLRGALNDHAEQAWSELDEGGQIIGKAMFCALAERSREGQDIRRPIEVQALLDITATDLPTLTKVIDTFRQPGRNFLMPPPHLQLMPDTTIDISHESLIRQWKRLQTWVMEENEKAAMYLRLQDAAQRHAREKGELWHGTDLALAKEWKSKTQPNAAWAIRYKPASTNSHIVDQEKVTNFEQAIKFLEKSEAEAQRQSQELETYRKAELVHAQQRLKLTFVGFLLALGLASWGYSERNNAIAAREATLKEAERAFKAEIATKIAITDAEKLFQRAIDAAPMNANSLGIFAIFMQTIRKDYARTEALYEQAIQGDPKNSFVLGNFAIFMNDIRKDYNRAEKLYEQAIAAYPGDADNLGNFAVFMKNDRKDYNHAEKLYEQAIAADPKHAGNLGNFAVFMQSIRKDNNRAEKLYEQAIAADPKRASNLGNFAVFMQTIRKDNNRAEKLYEQAIAADPKHANSLANFSQLKLIQGSYKEGRTLIDRSFSANPEDPAKLELWFYRLAHFPQDYPQAQTEIVNLLRTGARDDGWDFSGNIARAEQDGHADVALLKALSDVILNKAKFETLAPYIKQ
jgi:Tfp pilus assembly protein PilF/ABC-type oligopeptide transport system ATPase subunit